MNPALVKFTIPASSTVIDAIEAIKNNRSRCVIVVDTDRVIGVLSEGDIMSALLHDTHIHAPIAAFIQHSFKFLSERNIAGALEMMRRFGVTLIPVIDHDLHLVDAITLDEVLNTLSPGTPS
jgi:CBS domain-containing protein